MRLFNFYVPPDALERPPHQVAADVAVAVAVAEQREVTGGSGEIRCDRRNFVFLDHRAGATALRCVGLAGLARYTPSLGLTFGLFQWRTASKFR